MSFVLTKKLPFYILLVALVGMRFITTTPHFGSGDKVRITAKVSSEPIRYDTSQYLKLYGLKIYLPSYPEIFYGDLVIIEGVVEKKENGYFLTNPTLISHRISEGFLYTVRRHIVSFYQRSLPEPSASLIAGVTIGSKASIPEDFWNHLRISGTAHVVVASGMNVTLVSGFLLASFLLFIPRRKAVPFALVGVWVYALLSGFDAPIVRAAVMGSVALVAQLSGRLNTAWRALFLSGLCMLVLWPQWLIDLGFILSFVATASILLLSKRMERLFRKVPPFFRQDLATTVAAQIGVAPILFVSFGQFNLLSPFINVLVLWTIVPITVIGILGGVVGLIFEPLGTIILYLSYPLTSWFISIVSFFGQ